MADACHSCGFPLENAEDRCPKCDASQRAGKAGLCLQRDIAHAGQTVSEAMRAVETLLAQAEAEGHGSLRLIVGGGLIRSELMRRLDELRRSGRIRRFAFLSGNHGAVQVELP